MTDRLYTQKSIPLVEERPVSTAIPAEREIVTVRTQVQTDIEPVSIDLLSETVHVERIPKGEIIDDIPEPRTEENRTVIPVVREEIEVIKRLVLVEEIHLTKRRETRTVERDVELRKTVAEIDHQIEDLRNPEPQ